jgi:GNAT superfamily N-acetyltransferase
VQVLERRYPKELILKDCSEVTLRPLARGDADGLERFFSAIPWGDRWYLKEDPGDGAVVQKWIANQQAGKTFCVLALTEERIVAQASLLRHLKGGRQHIGRIRIMVAPDYRNRQLGTWMLFDLIRRAMELGLEKIRTDFVVGLEDKAIDAVLKLDFYSAARIKNYLRDAQGNTYDYQIMIKDLHPQWSDF